MKITSLGNNQMTLTLTNATVFVSYSTPVAAFVRDFGFVRAKERYSRTTTKHINAWLTQEAGTCHKDQVVEVPQFEIAALLKSTDPETSKATELMRRYFPTAMGG